MYVVTKNTFYSIRMEKVLYCLVFFFKTKIEKNIQHRIKLYLPNQEIMHNASNSAPKTFQINLLCTYNFFVCVDTKTQ